MFVWPDPATPQRCSPIGELLSSLAGLIAPKQDEARILFDNLLRLEREIRALFESAGCGIADAREVLLQAARALETSLALQAEPARQLVQWLDRLVGACPEGGVLVDATASSAQDILLTMATREADSRLTRLRGRAESARRRIKDLLAAERAKGASGQSGAALAGSVGGTDAGRLNADALSRVLGRTAGGAKSDPDRLRRLEDLLDVLGTFLQSKLGPTVHVVGATMRSADTTDGSIIWHEAGAAACETACTHFDRIAREIIPVFAALRVSALESSGQFDPARHGQVASGLTWQSLNREELLSLPPVVAIETQETLAGPGMLGLSHLLRSGRPVSVLVGVTAGGAPGGGQDLLGGYRLELAYLGMGHREALVSQSTVSRPVHLAEGFGRALNASRAALHVVDSGLDTSGASATIGAWLHGAAALEGRAHPLFHYDPERGETWARRLDFATNPAPMDDWPTGEILVEDGSGPPCSIATRFTFADFALLEPALRDQFRIVPDALPSGALIDAADFVEADEALAHDLIPMIWAADENGELRRLTFSRRLAFACRDRLGYWRTLQELAGVRNEHVREAVQAERERLATGFARERDALAASHASEIERVRAEAAGDALRRLAGALLDTEFQSLAPAAPPPARPQPATPAAMEQAAGPSGVEPVPQPAVEEADAGFDEPYVDTALCTSCNDCTNLNSRVFVYNANKQVVIGDPSAGTFAELVAAAEKCPARCIHPGKPSNADEPGLAELIARAKPFN
ncbi:MAG: ferredoxin [Phycisphaerales bacterium]|nr:ferredoxin [Phycisphaerales bacterium]